MLVKLKFVQPKAPDLSMPEDLVRESGWAVARLNFKKFVDSEMYQKYVAVPLTDPSHRERIEKIAEQVKATNEMVMPIIWAKNASDLISVKNSAEIGDGCHRIVVLRCLGSEYIECVVPKKQKLLFEEAFG